MSQTFVLSIFHGVCYYIYIPVHVLIVFVFKIMHGIVFFFLFFNSELLERMTDK